MFDKNDDDLVVHHMRILKIFFVSLVVKSIMNGLVLSLLWGWFFVPVFELPTISIIQAIGIGIVASFLVGYQADKNDNKDMSSIIEVLVTYIILRPIITIVIGYIVYLFL